MSRNEHENKVWLKKLVKSSHYYLKLKSKLEKEKQMNKMLLEHLMGLRCIEKDVERILELCHINNSNSIRIKEEPRDYGTIEIDVDEVENISEVVVEAKPETCERITMQVIEDPPAEKNVSEAAVKVEEDISEDAVEEVEEVEVEEVEDISEAAVVEEEVVEDISEDAVEEVEDISEAAVVEEEVVEEVEEVEEDTSEDAVEEVEEVEEVEDISEDAVEEVEEVEEEAADVFEIEYKGKRYYTTDEKNGAVYAILEDEDIGDQIGNFVNGKLVLL